MTIDTVFAILGIIFGCLLIITTLGMFAAIVAARKADEDYEEIERETKK